MRTALRLAAVFIVLGIFMPRVFAALEGFVYTLLVESTAIVGLMDPRATSAEIHYMTPL